MSQDRINIHSSCLFGAGNIQCESCGHQVRGAGTNCVEAPGRPFAGADVEGLGGAFLNTKRARHLIFREGAAQILHWRCSWLGGASQVPSHPILLPGEAHSLHGFQLPPGGPGKRGTRGVCRAVGPSLGLGIKSHHLPSHWSDSAGKLGGERSGSQESRGPEALLLTVGEVYLRKWTALTLGGIRQEPLKLRLCGVCLASPGTAFTVRCLR